MDQSSVNDFLVQPFERDDVKFSGEVDAAAIDIETVYGGPIIERIVNRVRQIKDWVTLEMVLAGARFAFDFAIGRIPFPIPDAIKTTLWTMLEKAIRALYAE